MRTSDEVVASLAERAVKAFDDRYELLGPLEEDWEETCLAAALQSIAHSTDWEADDPKFLLLAIASTLDPSLHS